MLRTLVVAVFITGLLISPVASFAQCLIPPPLDSCNGTEPSLPDNDVLGVGIRKWYYGAAATYNSVTLRGGTLVVCGNLTFNNFNMDSGTVVIRPGGLLRIGGGAGIVLRGNCNIYNYGTFECTSNLSLDPTWATPAKPNVVINATPSSIFKMSNQYFVINNTNSFFVNRGRAEFWGIITDFGAGSNSVCLGRFSEVRMAVLYNNRKHTYTAPEGSACVNVYQYSQFRDTLTRSMNINICLGAGHTSDASCIPFGCKPNAWGTTNIFNFCDQCAGLQLLSKPTTPDRSVETQSADINISPNPFSRKVTIRWKGESPREIHLYSMAGAAVYNQKLPVANTHIIDVQVPSALPAGKYFIKLVFEKKVLVRQIVKTG
jgi:hypothetical protein